MSNELRKDFSTDIRGDDEFAHVARPALTYNGFLSYSQDADASLGAAIQSSLQRLARPWYRIRVLRIFRDQSSLAATASLWASIERALADSEYFIFLASPVAKESPWVRREVEWWLANRPINKFLILLGSGNIVWDSIGSDFDWLQTNALPMSLKGRFSEEPRWVDFRTPTPTDPSSFKFRSGVLDIAATLRALPKDDLDGEDVRQHRRNRAAAAAAVILSLSLAAISTVEGQRAVLQRKRAESLLTQVLLEDSRVGVTTGDADVAASSLSKLLELSVKGTNIDVLRQALDDMRVQRFQLPASRNAGATDDPVADALDDSERESVEGSEIVGDANEQWCATFSPDAKYLLTAGESTSPRLWSLTDKTPTEIEVPNMSAATYCPKDAPPTRMRGAFAPDKSRVLLPVDGKYRILELPSLKEISELASDTLALALFDFGGRQILTRNQDTDVEVWSADTGKLLRRLGRGQEFILSPSSSRVLIVNSNGRAAAVWDYKTGIKLRSFTLAKGLDHGQIDPTGRKVIFFGESGATQFAVSQEQSQDPETLWQAPVKLAQYSPDGSRVAIVSNVTTIFDANEANGPGGPDSTGIIQPDRSGVVGNRIWDLVYSPTGSAIITAGLPAPATVWAPTTGNRRYYVVCNEKDINYNQPYGTGYSEISNDGSLVLTISTSPGGTSVLRLWRLPVGPLLASFRGIHPLVGPDNSWIGLLHSGELQLFDSPSFHLARTFSANAWDLDAGSNLFATANADGVSLWNARTFQLLRTLKGGPKAAPSRQKTSFKWDAASFDPTGKFIAAIAETCEFYVWRVDVNEPLIDDTTFSDKVGCGGSSESDSEAGVPAQPDVDHQSDELPSAKIQWGDDGKFVTVFKDRSIGVWNTSERDYVGTVEPRGIAVTDVQLQGSSDLVTISLDATNGSGEEHRYIKRWDLTHLEFSIRLNSAADESDDGAPSVTEGPQDDGYGFGYSFVGVGLIADSANGSVAIKDLNKEEDASIFTFKQQPQQIRVFRKIGDGSVILTAGKDSIATLWDAKTVKPLRNLEAHTGTITSAAFIPPDLIMTASEDKTVKIWRFTKLGDTASEARK